MRRLFGAMCCLVLLLFQACKTTEPVQRTGAVFSKEDKLRFKELLRNAPEYSTFTSRMTLTLRGGGGTLTTKATLRIVRDSLLQISIQPLMGIEMFRVQITPDSIVIVDKPGRRYMAEAIADYKSNLPVDLHLSSLQALFLNRIFIPGNENTEWPLELKDFRTRTDADGDWELVPVEKNQGQFIFQIGADNLLERTSITAFPGRQSLQWAYSEFEKKENLFFPMYAEVIVSGLSTPVSLEWNYQKPQWNKPVKTDLSVSSRYRKVEGAEILKALLK